MAKTTLPRLLERGDLVCIKKGRLIIKPASNKPVPDQWMKDNSKELIVEILELCEVQGLFFKKWSKGNYQVSPDSSVRKPGITLDFANHKGLHVAYTIFNVKTDRLRDSKNGKAGTPLSGKQFRVTERMAFYKFWLNAGLALPPRLSFFHDRMGNLKKVVFTGEYGEDSRLKCSSIYPLEISYDQILEAIKLKSRTSKLQTNSEQMANNVQTKIPYKSSSLVVINKGFQQFESTCNSKCENKVNSEKVVRGDFNRTIKKPYEQTTKEWFEDYDNA